ncbi:MAG TPA: hypothetical protein VLZ89_12405 [Anaerolineales bacterium]|nr:hypothetical protein [Anaerolineales bacterium]
MNIWTTLIGIAALLYAVYAVYQGKISYGNDSPTSSYIRRSEKPVLFWLNVAIMLALAVVLIFNVFHL